MEYQSFKFSDLNEIDRLLSATDKEDRIKAIVGMVNGVENWKWVQEKLIVLLSDEDFWVAKNAITGLGDLARIHGLLEREKVEVALNQITNPKLVPIVRETLQDIAIFLA